MRIGPFIFLVVLTFLATPAVTQDWKGQGRLEGRVLDPDGKPVEGAAVRLQLADRGSTELKTDKKGKWAILGLAGGSWSIEISAPGFEPRVSVVPVRETVSGRPLEVKLVKQAPQGPPPEILQAVVMGDQAYTAREFATARVHYLSALEKYAAFAGAQKEALINLHVQIAHCYSQEKNYPKELEHLQLVLDADPQNLEIRKLMAMEAFQGGMLDRGMELFQGVDQNALKNPDILYNIAVAFFNAEKVDQAIDYLSKAIAVNPTFSDGYFLRANAYLNRHQTADAKADYRRFLEVAAVDDPRLAAVKQVLEQLN